jgi:hypothetical protein
MALMVITLPRPPSWTSSSSVGMTKRNVLRQRKHPVHYMQSRTCRQPHTDEEVHKLPHGSGVILEPLLHLLLGKGELSLSLPRLLVMPVMVLLLVDVVIAVVCVPAARAGALPSLLLLLIALLARGWRV